MAEKQKAEQEEEPYGIYEIVSDSISITPCQYGMMRWDEEGNLTYQTKLTDVSGWAGKNGIDNGELLDFEKLFLPIHKRIDCPSNRKENGSSILAADR